MKTTNRPDLSETQIALMLGCLALSVLIIALLPAKPPPGSPVGQLSAITGSLLLMAPFLFAVMKRGGYSRRPPIWFILHVICTLTGCILVFVHVSAGNWLTPAGIILFLLVFLILQGSLLRTVISSGFSRLFARSAIAQGFNTGNLPDKSELQSIIDQKKRLLSELEPNASEALFSPTLLHWLRHPAKTVRYQCLAIHEAKLVGARASAGKGLSWARRIHMAAALLFYLGLVTHIIVMIFFAGYAADGAVIDWWHITDWGGP